jgi:hypothetical protein
VTPTPVPPPPPPPPTTIVLNLPPNVVDLNLPPDVVNKLSPHESGLPQSWATIIAACIAVLAALLALGGVWWQIRAAGREARRDRAVDARLSRQTHLIDRMAEAFALTRTLTELMRANRGPHDKWEAQGKKDFDDYTERGRVLINELAILGARESSAAFWRVIYLQNIAAKAHERGTPNSRPRPKLDGKHSMQLKSEMIAAFHTDLTGERPPTYRAAAVVTPHY